MAEISLIDEEEALQSLPEVELVSQPEPEPAPGPPVSRAAAGTTPEARDRFDSTVDLGPAPAGAPTIDAQLAATRGQGPAPTPPAGAGTAAPALQALGGVVPGSISGARVSGVLPGVEIPGGISSSHERDYRQASQAAAQAVEDLGAQEAAAADRSAALVEMEAQRQALESRRREDERAARLQAAMEARDEALQAVADGRIDPRRLYRTLDDGQRATRAFGLVAGSLLSMRRGVRNTALDALQNELETDIAIQREELARNQFLAGEAGNTLQLLRQEFADDRAAEEVLRALHWKGVEARARAEIDALASPRRRAEALQALQAGVAQQAGLAAQRASSELQAAGLRLEAAKFSAALDADARQALATSGQLPETLAAVNLAGHARLEDEQGAEFAPAELVVRKEQLGKAQELIQGHVGKMAGADYLMAVAERYSNGELETRSAEGRRAMAQAFASALGNIKGQVSDRDLGVFMSRISGLPIRDVADLDSWSRKVVDLISGNDGPAAFAKNLEAYRAEASNTFARDMVSLADPQYYRAAYGFAPRAENFRVAGAFTSPRQRSTGFLAQEGGGKSFPAAWRSLADGLQSAPPEKAGEQALRAADLALQHLETGGGAGADPAGNLRALRVFDSLGAVERRLAGEDSGEARRLRSALRVRLKNLASRMGRAPSRPAATRPSVSIRPGALGGVMPAGEE